MIHSLRTHVVNTIMQISLQWGERVIGPGLAKDIVTIWMATEFEGGRHERRVEKIKH